MKAFTPTREKTVSGAGKSGASAIRELIGGREYILEDARKQAAAMVSEAQKQARGTISEARKQARRQMIKARIAAAQARARTRSKGSGPSLKAIGVASAAGLAAGYFLDPESGKRRRHVARDRTLGLMRRGADRTRREAEYRARQVAGKAKAAKSAAEPEKPAANDQDLAERVKSQIFRPADAPKGSVNVNVERGVVYLRGEVDRPDEIEQLIEQAGSVDGVAAVENLLHTS
jgi:osmotically-inducible protein OsmY